MRKNEPYAEHKRSLKICEFGVFFPQHINGTLACRQAAEFLKIADGQMTASYTEKEVRQIAIYSADLSIR